MYYATEKRPILKAKHDGITFGELSKMISSEWKALSEDDKKPYHEKHAEDKKRYDKEMKNYKPPSPKSESSSDDSDSSSSDDKKKKNVNLPQRKGR